MIQHMLQEIEFITHEYLASPLIHCQKGGAVLLQKRLYNSIHKERPEGTVFDYILSVFSACCEIRTDLKVSFNSLLSRVGLGHLGKGWIYRGTTPRRLPYWANGFFYPSWNRLCRCTAYHSSVADCQALT